MLKAIGSTGFTALLLPALFLSAKAQDAPPPLASGTAAPAFTTKTLDGKSISLKSLRGKVVLIDFWATWCTPCRAAIPMLQSLHQKFGSKGLEVIGLSVDEKESVGQIPAFKKQLKVTYTLSANPQGNQKIGQAYNVEGIPAIFLIDQKGVVRWSHSGYRDGNGEDELLSQKIKELLGSGSTAKMALKTARK